MKKYLTLSLLFLVTFTHAQTGFNGGVAIDINNIKAMSLYHGDLWRDPSTWTSHCLFPAGSDAGFSYSGAVWMSGYDGSGGLHLAAQVYRQKGLDYWPGPLDPSGILDHTTSGNWAKIWKVNRTEVNEHKAATAWTEASVPKSILYWPGKGSAYAKGRINTPLTVTTEMAPFVDLDGDGIYEPLNGEYPDFRGDQALWYVFSDNGPTHGETNAAPLKVEVHALVYAFSRGTLIDNVVYYDYTVFNKSGNDYYDFRFAIWNDAELGYYLDDYIGFDSAHRLGITYNGTNDDGDTIGHPPGTYGLNPPAAGVTFVELPGDGGGSYVPVGSFMYYENSPSPDKGNPDTANEYNNYMRATWKSGTHLKYDPTTGSMMSGVDRNYVFPDAPGVSGGWNECTMGNTPGDRRFILSSGGINFNAGSRLHYVMAVVADEGAGGCPLTDISGLLTTTDTAWYVYHNPLPPLGLQGSEEAVRQLHIYPNPAHDKLFIDAPMAGGAIDCRIYDMLGREMYHNTLTKLKSSIDIANYPPGVYYMQYHGDNIDGKEVFVKQ